MYISLLYDHYFCPGNSVADPDPGGSGWIWIQIAWLDPDASEIEQ